MTASAATTWVGLHDRLRAGTADLHHAAEAAFNPRHRLSTMDSYVDLLDRLWALHAGIEAALGVHGPRLFGLELEARRRSPLLGLDLQATARRHPRFAPVPFTYASPAAALGGLYVLEGSTLGGRVLIRLAEASLGVSRQRGGRFLAGHGSDTGRLWRDFLEALAVIPAGGDAGDQAVAGARRTFAAFVDRLADCQQAALAEGTEMKARVGRLPGAM